jgi:hypothetical protein
MPKNACPYSQWGPCLIEERVTLTVPGGLTFTPRKAAVGTLFNPAKGEH